MTEQTNFWVEFRFRQIKYYFYITIHKYTVLTDNYEYIYFISDAHQKYDKFYSINDDDN